MSLLGLLLLTLFCSEIQSSPVNYIINGELAEKCEFPHIAYLSIRKASGTYYCSGSLIDDRHIVTAAHCLDDNVRNIHAFFGSLNMNFMTNVIPATYTVHSGYHPTDLSFINDIAMVTLSRPVKFSSCIKPIRLVKPSEEIRGKKCVIAGWGQTGFYSRSDWLLRAEVPIMSPETCDRRAAGIETQHVCAGDGTYNGKSTCKGDSGGPLMCKSAVDGKTVLVGVVSYGWTCKEGLSVYTSVRYFHKWIVAHSNIN